MHIYTDHSKTAEHVGCAFVVKDDIYDWQLRPAPSIFTEEPYAIWQALRYTDDDQNNVCHKLRFTECSEGHTRKIYLRSFDSADSRNL
nr:unnamed protein product [Callosobruchus analis]